MGELCNLQPALQHCEFFILFPSEISKKYVDLNVELSSVARDILNFRLFDRSGLDKIFTEFPATIELCMMGLFITVVCRDEKLGI